MAPPARSCLRHRHRRKWSGHSVVPRPGQIRRPRPGFLCVKSCRDLTVAGSWFGPLGLVRWPTHSSEQDAFALLTRRGRAIVHFSQSRRPELCGALPPSGARPTDACIVSRPRGNSKETRPKPGLKRLRRTGPIAFVAVGSTRRIDRIVRGCWPYISSQENHHGKNQ